MNRIVVTSALGLLVILGQSLCLAESVDGKPSEYETTIRRFFANQSSYRVGDLITRSQVEELQTYLRRTRRRGPASHPQVLQRILPDKSRLAKIFYSKNGEDILRVAAQKLGGYAVLEVLTKTTSKYNHLVEAVSLGSVDEVVKLAESVGEGQRPKTAKTEARKKRRKKVIYTVDEFLKAVMGTLEAKMPAEEPQQ